jgi:Amt family ammonium transporter
VFGIHGVGGIVGAILTGMFASEAIGGKAGLLEGNPGQVMAQVYGVLATIVWSGVVSLIILKVIDATIGLRVREDIERDSLDLQLHGETVQ